MPSRPPEQPLSDAVLARLRDALKDSYLVERELGEGGAATVYLARDIKHERNVAILGRLKLAAGDTSGAVRTWRWYLARRGRAEPSQKKLDDDIRKTLAEIERKKR